jgi:hypothetical protein
MVKELKSEVPAAALAGKERIAGHLETGERSFPLRVSGGFLGLE